MNDLDSYICWFLQIGILGYWDIGIEAQISFNKIIFLEQSRGLKLAHTK